MATDEKTKRTNLIVTIASSVVIAGGLAIGFVGQHNYATYAPETRLAQKNLSELQTKADKQQKKLNKLVNQQATKKPATADAPTVVLNNDLKTDPTIGSVTNNLNDIFGLMYTYTDSKTYTSNRDKVMTQVHDDAFGKYYQSGEDAFGQNAVDVLSLKSKLQSVEVYQVGDDEYYARVQYIPYKTNDDLNADGLQANTVFFDIKGTAGNYTQFTPQTKLSTLS